MNKSLSIFVSFILGTMLGAITGWNIAKKKYEKLADAEVASVREALTKHYEKKPEPIKAVPQPGTKDAKEPKPIITKNDVKTYKDYAKKYETGQGPNLPIDKKSIKEEDPAGDKAPYVITSDEFKESNYESQTLYYFADRVLADSDENILLDVIGAIGDIDITAELFNDSDVIYVRNDKQGIDYEILLDERYFNKSHEDDHPLDENE